GVTEAHVEGGPRGDIGAERSDNAPGFGSVGGASPIAVSSDHTDVARRNSCILQGEFDGAFDTVAVGTQLHDTRCFAHATGAQKLAEDAGLAFRCAISGLKNYCTRSFAK